MITNSRFHHKPSDLKCISRREILKLGVIGSVSLVLGPMVSACTSTGATPAPTSTPTATSTPLPRNASSSTGQQLANTKTMTTKDGRKIAYVEAGKPDGIPVVVFHGSPGCRLLYDPWVADAASRGIRLIGYDRPGYGESTPLPGRSVAAAADDVAALAKQLGLSKLFVWGLSAGGPHALACAALLPDLVVAAAALASLAPFNAVGLDWWKGMNADNYTEFTKATKGRDAMKGFFQGSINFYAQNIDPKDFHAGTLGELPPAEAAAFTQEQSDFFLDYNREAYKGGEDGNIDDDIAFVNPWGFDVSQIRIPLMIMQGDQDWYCPFTHGKWLASQIKNADIRFITGEGHLAMLNHAPEVHAWLLSKMK